MKKALFCSLAMLILPMTVFASFNGESMKGVDAVIIERNDYDNESDGRPRTPALRLFAAFLDTVSNHLSVTARFDVGNVYVVIENLSTGEYSVHSFDSSETAILPISGDSGCWRITLTLESGAEYVGKFLI